jgi:hypothetical protein
MLVVGVRVIGYGSSSLLLSAANTANDASLNGLWKMNVDGTGLTRLTSTTGTFNQFTQYPWSNFSRDDKLYTASNSYGSLERWQVDSICQQRCCTDRVDDCVNWLCIKTLAGSFPFTQHLR